MEKPKQTTEEKKDMTKTAKTTIYMLQLDLNLEQCKECVLDVYACLTLSLSDALMLSSLSLYVCVFGFANGIGIVNKTVRFYR